MLRNLVMRSAARTGRWPGFKAANVRYADVIATLALFVALGGSAYAVTALPRNSVTSPTVKNGSLRAADLAKNSVTSKAVKDGSITAADLVKTLRPGATGGLAGQTGSAGSSGANGGAGATGAAGTNGTNGTNGRDGAAIAAAGGPLPDIVLNTTWQQVGALTYSQPPGAVDDVRGHFSLRGAVGNSCASGSGLQYQIIVDGQELNFEQGAGGNSGNAAKDDDGLFLQGINGTDTTTDVLAIGSEFPVINDGAAAVTRTVEVFMRKQGSCAPNVLGLRLYVTRFLR